MDSSSILIGTGVLCLIAIVLAITISMVAQRFHVEEDPLIGKIYEILPHINCGACGHPGCQPYAEALVNDGDDINKCKPGGPTVTEKIRVLLAENK